jgi:hypothetical protein
MKIYTIIILAFQFTGLGIAMARDEKIGIALTSIAIFAPYHLLAFGVI